MTRVLRSVRAILGLALVACGSSPPPPTVLGPPPPPAAVAPLSPRDALIAQLHASEQVMVIDISLLPVATYSKALTEAIRCTAPLIAARPLVILGGDLAARGEGIITNLDEAATKTCIAQLAPWGVKAVAADNDLHITVGATTYRLRWTDGLLRISAVGSEPTGSLSPDLMARIATIPTDAGFWMISSGSPESQIARSHLWVRVDATHIILESVADGTAPGAAARWLSGVQAGFRTQVDKLGLQLPDEPFGTITANGSSARLDASIPLSLFRPDDAL